MNLSIYDIINNAKDELERAREIIILNEETKEMAENSMLISDIDSSLERMENITDRIEFALLLANTTGYSECKNGMLSDATDESPWRKKYIEVASEIELEYEKGYVDTEWAYEKVAQIVEEWEKDICKGE